MTIWEAVRVALSGLRSNKLRSALTCLGVIIGVGAVIAMIAMGQGASADVQERIQSMGTNLLIVWPGQARQGRVWGGVGSQDSLSSDDGVAIAKECKSVSKSAPVVQGQEQIKAGNANSYVGITGSTSDWPSVQNYEVERGRFFNAMENRTNRKVAVIGATTRNNLFPNSDPIGKKIQVRNMHFLVIGLLKPKGGSDWHDPDDVVVIPLGTFLRRLGGGTKGGKDVVNRIYVEASGPRQIVLAQAEIEQLLRRRHRILTPADDDFNVRTQTEILGQFEGTSKTFTLLLAGIAAVSLLVGGIGIMNIMLVSVTERTREIGIRKAIGATGRDILLQFLVESVVLSVIGGLIGIGLGVGGARMLSKFAGWRTLVSPQSIVMAFCFAAGVGVFFGIYPAQKAAALDPIEALRYE
ncbi:MAG: multidrug ABC transporter substrate-binding protein [Armatimonadetes bacterium CG17_big_fil_post_rev_8_21_14_2_50_66_6]|nr:MAG: multidrug ABC transporter substrate-binding protein [Armatimonadetes bacterium CG17_big_fil_post_rev_8_21_14_2_50_66_6]